jgi:Ca2+-binding RTX toxin-like protein
VIIEGLATDWSLSHGIRNHLNGHWTVAASDLDVLRLVVPTYGQAGQHDVRVRYQQSVGPVWQDVSRATISVHTRDWLQPGPNSTVEDFRNFSQYLQAWNLGLTGLSGRGIKAEAEGGHIVVTRDDFHKGNVLAGSTTGTVVGNHGLGVGQRIAGAMDSSFVGLAYGAQITWGPTSAVDIDNNSYGYGSGLWVNGGEPALDPAITQGRGGLGRIVVFSAGNEGPTANVSLMLAKKEPAYLAIASLDNGNGSVADFSNAGEALLGAAAGWGGTSHAAPHVAGMTALMLEANRGLGFRDIQEILAYSANYLPTAGSSFNSFDLNQARTLNGVGLHFSRTAGFGSLNAYNAVRLSADWLRGGFEAATITGWTHKTPVDPNSYKIAATASEVTQITFNTNIAVRIDSLQLEATYTDRYFTKMVINLISPSGTVSPIAVGNNLGGGERINAFIRATSKRFWGETSEGVWTLELSHSGDTPGDALVKDLRLIFYGGAGEVSQRHVYTDERRATWDHLANAIERQRMLWLDDHDGGQDVVMGSALTKDMTVHLGRNGWLQFDGIRTSLAPGTRIENAFGGDGNDLLVGRADGKSILLGNLGADILMGFGQDSQLEGGDDGDWLWVGGNTVAHGGEGADRFMIYRAASLDVDIGLRAIQLPDFDPNEDALIRYDALGNFEIARFDLRGSISHWAAVIDLSYLQQLKTQWQQAAPVSILNIDVTVNSVRIDFDMPVSDEGFGFAKWTAGSMAPDQAVLDGDVLTLRYSAPLRADTVIDLAGARLHNSLGRSLSYQQIYLGDTGANVLDASAQLNAVVLYGGGGDDRLIGGSGADLLFGSAGTQLRLTGGAGADVFKLTGAVSDGGVCEITDFALQENDRLDLDSLFANLSADVDFLDCMIMERKGQDLWLGFDLFGQPSLQDQNFFVNMVNFYTANTISSNLLESLVQGMRVEI